MNENVPPYDAMDLEPTPLDALAAAAVAWERRADGDWRMISHFKWALLDAADAYARSVRSDGGQS